MKRERDRKAPRRRAARLRWKPYGGLIFGPIEGPHGSSAGVFVVRDGRRYGVMALSTPTGAIGMGALGVLEDHAHAIIAEDVRSLSEAKRLGEAWARKFRKGLVLAPCDCEDMREVPSARGSAWDNDVVRAWTGRPEAGAPSATRRHGTGQPIGLLPAASPSAADLASSPSAADLASRIRASGHFSPEEKAICARCGHTRIEHLTFAPAPCCTCACREFQAGAPSAIRQPHAGAERSAKITHADDTQRISAEPRTFTREGTPPKPGVTAGETA